MCVPCDVVMATPPVLGHTVETRQSQGFLHQTCNPTMEKAWTQILATCLA